MKRVFISLLTLASVAAAAGFWWSVQADTNGKHQFRTLPIERGTVVARISATGTLQPVTLVDVGAQVNGQIRSFGPEIGASFIEGIGGGLALLALTPTLGSEAGYSFRPIDYCSRVEEGTVLAYIDDALFKSQVANAQADLKLAEADQLLAEAKLRQAERDWQRARELGPRGVVSGLDYDTIRANYESCSATAYKGRAAVAKAQALLEEAQTRLGYTVIRSPVKGVIIDRRVNIGQTVVASLNAPSLFLIAQDLKQLEIWAAVNEADIGQIFIGQAVRFSVDTFPDEEFRGQVRQIRLNANMQQNVVTYTVVVATDNSQERLRPYMTTNLEFEISQKDDVLVVPNAALRWRPQAEYVAPAFREEFIQSSRRRPLQPERGKPDKERSQLATVWIESNGFIQPLQIRTGLTDGVVTEIRHVINGTLSEDSVVVSGTHANGNGRGVSPLMPRVPR